MYVDRRIALCSVTAVAQGQLVAVSFCSCLIEMRELVPLHLCYWYVLGDEGLRIRVDFRRAGCPTDLLSVTVRT